MSRFVRSYSIQGLSFLERCQCVAPLIPHSPDLCPSHKQGLKKLCVLHACGKVRLEGQKQYETGGKVREKQVTDRAILWHFILSGGAIRAR